MLNQHKILSMLYLQLKTQQVFSIETISEAKLLDVKPKCILVSACLLGESCKYNGGHNYNQALVDYVADKDVIAVCPDLSVPPKGFHHSYTS